MKRTENLPPGFWRSPSGSLRVQIRAKGFKPLVKTFPLFEETPEARRRQRSKAELWAAETRRRLQSGTHVSTRAAESMSLGDALRAYEREGLRGKPKSLAEDGYRIKAILADPIAERAVAALKRSDIAAYRDELLRLGWMKSVEAAIARLGDDPKHRQRVAELRLLDTLSRQAREAGSGERRAIEARIAEIEVREGVKKPARTTITNRLQLITRALKFVGQTIEGVPDLRGVPMPKASPGRERRVSSEELHALLIEGAKVDRRLPLIIRFAVETALRRERILTVRETDIREIGSGKQAIVFPKETSVRNKRTGIIPITREIRAIIDQALLRDDKEGNVVLQRGTRSDEPIFGVPLATFTSWWKRLLRVTGIQDLHFHDLRHEATSRLFEKGLTTAEVMSITGHSTTDMVDRYSHYSAALVHDKLERGLDPTAILDEIVFLANQYKALSGDMCKLQVILDANS